MTLTFRKLSKRNLVLILISLVFAGLCGLFSPGGRHLAYFLTAIPWSLFIAFIFKFIYKKCQQDRNWTWRFLLIAGLNIASLTFLLQRDNWPHNHEYVNFNSRTICYAMHYKECDFFPIWGSAESHGLGEPMPLYYHKLFYHVSGPIYMFTENIKLSMLLAIMFFNVVGVLGLYKLFRRFKLSINTSLFLGLTLLFQNYYATEIFVRGALAEFSALMVVPWLLWWCVKFMQEEKFDLRLPFILFAVYLAHSIIGFYGVFMLLIFFGCKFLSRPTIPHLKHLLKYGALSGLIFGILIAPIAILMYILSASYDPSTIKFEVRNFFQNFSDYFYDNDYLWGLHFDGYTVQLNFLLWGTLLTLAVFAYLNFRKQKTPLKIDYILLALVLSFLFFFALQHKAFAFFYDYVPGADYIQFPWRLLCFIVVLGIVLIGYLIKMEAVPQKVMSHKAFSLALLIGFVVGFPMYKNSSEHWEWMDDELYERKNYVGVYGIGEYTPVIEGVHIHDHEDTFYKLHYLGNLYYQWVIFDEPSKAQIEFIPYKQEKLEVAFNIYCEQEMQAIFHVNYSGLEVITIERENGERAKLKAYRTPKDPRIHCVIPEGKYRFTIHLPSYFNLFI